MKTSDIFKRSSAKINESIEQIFGKKINLESFTLDQLQDARNKLRTQISQVRSESAFNETLENEAFTQAQWMLDAINAEIAEREEFIVDPIEEYQAEGADQETKAAHDAGYKDASQGKKRTHIIQGHHQQRIMTMDKILIKDILEKKLYRKKHLLQPKGKEW